MRHRSATLLAVLTLVACESSVDQVAAPGQPQFSQSGGWQQKVTGAGHFDRPFSRGTFQVSAQSDAGGLNPRGNAAITANQDYPYSSFDVQGPVTCLFVAGNKAAVGIKVAKGTWGGVDVTGQGIVLNLEDNGQPGKGVPDGESNGGFYPDGDAIPCAAEIGTPAQPNPSGNVVIDTRP